ncbi:MAG: aryl-sulfate sulfotransferase [Nocardiopsaceae bacterium]|nr:aryl-sulfate sulfotransferase [Nocardiopsaceae bacterium]
MTCQEWTRRQAIGRGGALIAGASGIAAAAPVLSRPPALSRPRVGPGPAERTATTTAGTSGTADTQLYWNFVSRPDLRPPIVTITKNGPFPGHEPGYLFIVPHGYPLTENGQPTGLMIMDWDGQVVWFLPPTQTADGVPLYTNTFGVQSYRGKPVLTWHVNQTSFGEAASLGYVTIADATYTPVASVSAVGGGFGADLHDCVLTSRGTAYTVVARMKTVDLTPIGGPTSAPVVDFGVQEIDIATGNLLFQWDALDHIPLDESYITYSSATPDLTDPYHLNSVAVAPDGNLLISCRNTWTVYKVSRATGAIIWRLGGKRSDFTMGPGAGFAWQHDVKPQGPGDTMLSIFDNEATPQEAPQSRAIFLRLDTTRMRAWLLRAYTRPGGVLADNQGSVQPLEGGQVLVGWGARPYFTLFSPGGQVLLDGQFPDLGGTPDEVYQSYRTLSFPWSATPTEAPAAAARPGGADSSVVYASWNGATEVARWTVLAGPRPTALTQAGSHDRTGFETTIPVASTGPYFTAVAEDAWGRELGRSAPVTLPAS